MGIIDGVLIFFEYGDFLGKALPSGEWEEFTKSLAILSAISWYWKIIILLAVNLIILFVGSFNASVATQIRPMMATSKPANEN